IAGRRKKPVVDDVIVGFGVAAGHFGRGFAIKVARNFRGHRGEIRGAWTGCDASRGDLSGFWRSFTAGAASQAQTERNVSAEHLPHGILPEKRAENADRRVRAATR